MGFEGFPFIVGWELTLFCNLDCRHCGSAAGLSRVHELTLSEALALCDQFPELLVREVNFTGGEPLLSPNWRPVATRLADLCICTKIITNGLTLHDSVLEQMQEAGIAGVGISLDGLEDTHDYIRGHPGLFRRVLVGIERAQAAGFPVTIITTANALNINQLPEMLSLLQSLGIRRWQIQPIFPLGRASENSELLLTEADYLELGRFSSEWRPRAAAVGFELLPGNSFGYFTDLDDRQPPWRGCPAGLVSCGITSDGKVKGCLSQPERFIEGDLRERDLWNIWFDPGAFTYSRGFSMDELGPLCQSCPLAAQCQGGCTAMSYGSTGRTHNDRYCFYGIMERQAACSPVLA